MSSQTPPLINPRYKRWVKVRYRIIRAAVIGTSLGFAAGLAIGLMAAR